MEKNRATILTSVISLLIGIIYLFESIKIRNNPHNLQSSSAGVGAETFPIIIAVIMIIVSIIVLLQAVSRIKKNQTFMISISNTKRILVVLLSLAIYILLWTYTGYFFLWTYLFLLFLFMYLSGFDNVKKYFLQIILIDLVVVLFIDIVFVRVMVMKF